MFQITTTNPRRRQRWQRIFDTDKLPVFAAAPRQQERLNAPGCLVAYDLALRQLHFGQRDRLAAYLSRRFGLDYGQMRDWLETAVSFPIEATEDVKLVESTPRAFSLGGRRLWRDGRDGRAAIQAAPNW